VKRIGLGLCVLVLVSFGLLGWAAGERVLRVTFAWPTYIDPAVGSDYSSSSALVNLYDTLVYPAVDGTPMAHVATSWEISPPSARGMGSYSWGALTIRK